MKKGLTILMLAVMLLSCENETSYEAYPEMGEFYTESCGLKAVSTDSVKNFAVKVDNFVVKNPEAKQHSLYPKIVENKMSQGQVNDIKNNAQFLGFKNDRGIIPLCYDFPCKFIKIK